MSRPENAPNRPTDIAASAIAGLQQVDRLHYFVTLNFRPERLRLLAITNVKYLSLHHCFFASIMPSLFVSILFYSRSGFITVESLSSLCWILWLSQELCVCDCDCDCDCLWLWSRDRVVQWGAFLGCWCVVWCAWFWRVCVRLQHTSHCLTCKFSKSWNIISSKWSTRMLSSTPWHQVRDIGGRCSEWDWSSDEAAVCSPILSNHFAIHSLSFSIYTIHAPFLSLILFSSPLLFTRVCGI